MKKFKYFKFIFLILIAVISLIILLIFFCFRPFKYCEKNEKNYYQGSHHIILDTDTAGDDAVAISMLVKAPNIKIEGITVLSGNVSIDQAAKNALMTLEVMERDDIPVYKGATTTFDGSEKECIEIFGKDGMGDKDLIHPKKGAQEKNAIDYIIETVEKYPGDIEIFLTGPATNLAMAIKKEPDIAGKIKCVWSMGTAGFGAGNATPVSEFNVYKDAKAYEFLISKDIPMKIIGLDVCTSDELLFSDEKIKEILELNAKGKFLADSCSKIIAFKKEGSDVYKGVDLPDSVAVTTMICPDFIEEQTKCSACCIADGGPAHGQVIFYKENHTYDGIRDKLKVNKTVISKLKPNFLQNIVLDLLRK